MRRAFRTRPLLSGAALAACLSLIFLAAANGSFAQTLSSRAPLVDRLVIRDTIQPITVSRLERALTIANHDHASAVLIDLDTPGGLLDSTRQMVGDILSSSVPVIVYIAPAGSRGGSAGFFLLESADIAAMAPGTNAGASHPVLESGTPDDTMKAKMENDAAAFLRSYVGRHNRNAQLAEDAVRKSSAYSADEALNQHLIDLIANSDAQLLASIDGRTIARVDAAGKAYNQTLRLTNAQIETIEPTVREQLLGVLANPNIALLLLFGGALLIYLEFNVPGTVVPGALGTLMVLLAVFSLDLLPIRHTAVLLLLAAGVLMLLELKFASHGVLAAASIVCLAFGTLTLIDAPIPELGIRPIVTIALCVSFGLITLLLLRLAIAARRSKSLMGPAALVGSPATAMETLGTSIELSPKHAQKASQDDDLSRIPGSLTSPGPGHILIQGEIWQAVSTEPVAAHTKVKVTGFQGDILQVQPLSQAASSESQPS